MSEHMPISRAALVDTVGLRIQELHASGKLPGDQPLLRIDNRERAREAPFQFDAAKGQLHRTGCRAIPTGSDSALYAVWEVKAEDPALGCSRCNPIEAPPVAEPEASPRAEAKPLADAKPRAEAQAEAKSGESRPQDDHAADLLYGFLSIVTQFGGVLRERGQEYRRSRAGAAVGARFEKIYAEVNEGERRVLDVLTSSLDTLAVALREIEGGINERPDGDGFSASRPQPHEAP
jgi:hypothetical protein